jgi:hypothetical protein
MAGRVAVVLVILAAAGALAAFFVLSSNGDDDPALSTISNRGRPIELEFAVRIGAGEAKPTGEVMLLAERAGLRFLRLPRTDGSSCWAIAERRSGLWQLTSFNCETGFTRFPDREQPVMTVGRLQISPVNQRMNYLSFAGFAADGVNRVAIVDAADRVIPVTNVVDNVFFTPTPPQDVKTVAALDAEGKVIWRGAGVPPPVE